MEEYHRLLEAGVLQEDDPVEPIEGGILEMGPGGGRQVAAVSRLARVFFSQVGDKAMVSVQNPVRLGELGEPLYAKAGIPEVGLLDLVGGRLEAYRRPSPEGYPKRPLLAEGEVAPLALPEAPLSLKSLLP